MSFLHVRWISFSDVEDAGTFVCAAARVAQVLLAGPANVRRVKKFIAEEAHSQLEEEEDRVKLGKEVRWPRADFSCSIYWTTQFTRKNSEFFDEDFVVVERIVDFREFEVPVAVVLGEGDEKVVPLIPAQVLVQRSADGIEAVKEVGVRRTIHALLVKWTGMSYLDMTWEWNVHVDDDAKIAQYYKFVNRPVLRGAHEALFSDVRPDASQWKRYRESPLYKGDR